VRSYRERDKRKNCFCGGGFAATTKTIFLSISLRCFTVGKKDRGERRRRSSLKENFFSTLRKARGEGDKKGMSCRATAIAVALQQ
jgi:hypothetical protein